MNTAGEKIRILLSKTAQDGHEVALRYIAQTMRDAGMEVIYMRHEMIDEVIKTAQEEDVDVIGLQYYGGGMMYEVTTVMKMLKQQEMQDVKVVIGGTITPQEKTSLLGMGVAEVFLPGQGTVMAIPGRIKEILGTKTR